MPDAHNAAKAWYARERARQLEARAKQKLREQLDDLGLDLVA